MVLKQNPTKAERRRQRPQPTISPARDETRRNPSGSQIDIQRQKERARGEAPQPIREATPDTEINRIALDLQRRQDAARQGQRVTEAVQRSTPGQLRQIPASDILGEVDREGQPRNIAQQADAIQSPLKTSQQAASFEPPGPDGIIRDSAGQPIDPVDNFQAEALGKAGDVRYKGFESGAAPPLEAEDLLDFNIITGLSRAVLRKLGISAAKFTAKTAAKEATRRIGHAAARGALVEEELINAARTGITDKAAMDAARGIVKKGTFQGTIINVGKGGLVNVGQQAATNTVKEKLKASFLRKTFRGKKGWLMGSVIASYPIVTPIEYNSLADIGNSLQIAMSQAVKNGDQETIDWINDKFDTLEKWWRVLLPAVPVLGPILNEADKFFTGIKLGRMQSDDIQQIREKEQARRAEDTLRQVEFAEGRKELEEEINRLKAEGQAERAKAFEETLLHTEDLKKKFDEIREEERRKNREVTAEFWEEYNRRKAERMKEFEDNRRSNLNFGLL